jgi:hypothetical protein
MEVEALDGPRGMGILTGQFGMAQLEDPNLQNARVQVIAVDGVLLPGVSDRRYPHFAIKHNLLYQVAKHNGYTKDLLLIPSQYVRTVMQLAHTHLLGAHLGIEKTRERIGNRFHWPGVKRTVEDYYRSCPECQTTVPRVHYRNPLVP